jgi:hypothetical protein
MKRRLFALAALAALAGACGGDPDIGGIFMVTYHTENDMDCTEGTPQAAPFDPPYFRLKMDNFIVDYYSLDGCTSMDPATCDAPGLFGSFFQPISDGWKGETYSVSPLSPPCTLFYSLNTAVRKDGGAIRIEMTDRRMDDATTCTTDEAERLKDSLPCDGFEVIEGTRVADEG